MIVLFILYILISLFLICVVIALIVGLIKGAPYFPTPKSTIRKMLTLAQVKPEETVYDLGSGDGRVLLVASKDFKARGVGYEISLFYYLWSKTKIKLLGQKNNIDIYKKDFFKADFFKADVIIIFLLQDTNEKLEDLFKSKLHRGTRIVSRYFTLPNLKEIDRNEKRHLYLYKI